MPDVVRAFREPARRFAALDESACPICGSETCEEHLPVPAAKPSPDKRDSLSREPEPSRPNMVAPDEPLTESGAAERFGRLHGDDVRYDHRRGRWLLWDQHRWTPDTDDALVRLAINFARAWQAEALGILDPGRRDAVMKFALRLERRDAMRNVLTLARAIKPISDPGTRWDMDPWLLGVRNGVVDLKTGRLRNGRRADLITMSTAVPFNNDATCPRWDRFVSEVFAGDTDLIAFIQRAVGYSISGDTSAQCLFLGHGLGANGKGTFQNTLKRMLGDYAWNMPFATIEMRDRAAIPNDLAALVGRRFVIASETNDGTRLNESRIKALTGCDPITARFLHAEFFTFDPVAKFWLAVNHKPVVKDDSYGFWRRLRLVPFTRTFDVDETLSDALLAESSGILRWAVEGCLAWQRDGLVPPGIVKQATADYEHDSDPLAAFFDEACEIAAESSTGARELYEHYKHWAQHHGIADRDLMKVQLFGRKMGERFASRKDSKSGVKFYHGVARRTAPAD